MGQENKNTYFAFISYQRQDEEIAKKLQRTLEFYKLPIAIIEKRPELKEGVRPIFVDMTELGDEPFLSQAIKNALAESQFLIVICSPRSAQSKWVNKEVQYFVKLKRTKRIIPFIIEGRPNSEVKEEECCTPIMRKLLGQKELLGINIAELGFDAAAVKVVSRMFRVKFSSLWNRYEKEKEKEQRRLKEQNDRLMIAQSRYVAEKANELVEEGDSYSAQRLLLSVLPEDVGNPNDKAYAIEAEVVLRKAVHHQNAILKGHTDKVIAVAFSPDGKRIASTSEDMTIRIWDAGNGLELLKLEGHTREVLSFAFSPDSKHIVSSSNDDTVRLWDVEKGIELLKLKGVTNYILSVAFSPDGRRVVSGSGDLTIRIWDVKTGLELLVLDEHTDWVSFVAFSPDGKRIVSTSYDGTIRIWDAESGMELLKLEGTGATFVAFSPDSRRIVSAFNDDVVRVWDADTGIELLILGGDKESLLYATFSSDGSRIVSAYEDSTIRIWDAENGLELYRYDGHTSCVNCATFSPDGKRVVSTSEDNLVRIWEAEEGFELFRYHALTNCVESAAFCPDGGHIVLNYRDGTVRIWDAENGLELKRMDGRIAGVISSAFSPDGKRIVLVSKDQTVRIWDVENGMELLRMESHLDWVSFAAFSPDGKRIVSGSWYGTEIIWDAENGRELWRFEHGGESRFFGHFSVAFSPDGRSTVKIYGGRVTWRFENHLLLFFDLHVSSAAFSPDGKCIAFGGEKIRIWDAENGMELMRLEGIGATSIAFSPDSRRIVSCEDNTVKIWDVETGLELLRFDGHKDAVLSAAFSPDGRRIISASRDNTVRIWDFPPLQDLIDQTRERFKDRPLTSEERKQYYLE